MPDERRRRIQVSSPMARVRLAPVQVNGGQVPHQAVEIMDDDQNWQCLSIHSSNYNLVPNSVVSDVAERIMAQTGTVWMPERQVWNGKFWAQLYRSDLHVHAPEVDDTLALGLRIENSYDGSCQFRIVLMGYVLSCTNGLVSPRHFSHFSMRHVGSGEVNIPLAVAKIRQGLEELENVLPIINQLSRIPLTVDLISEVANEVGLPAREWGPICKLLGGSTTAWDLMQCVTHRLSHHGRGKAGLQSEAEVGDFFFSLPERYGAA